MVKQRTVARLFGHGNVVDFAEPKTELYTDQN